MKRSLPILLYHHVAPDREVTPEGFHRQLESLLAQGYRSLSVDEIVAILRGERPEGPPGFGVTFDDGYVDNWLHAFPILQQLHVRATMYLVTDRIEPHPAVRTLKEPLDTRTHEREPGGFLSWSEVRAMYQSGLVEFGSHTHTHRHFIRGDRYADIGDELKQSKTLIEKESGGPCVSLAWPWGDYKPEWLDIARDLGFHSAATDRPGANYAGSDPWTLKRLSVRKGNPSWLRSRLRWQSHVWSARLMAPWYGLDQRLKVWWNRESPYAHG